MTAKKLPTLKSCLCPQCLTPFQIDPDAYFKCTGCGGEFWPDPMGNEDKKQIEAEFSHQYVSRGQVNNKVKGGGSCGKKYGAKEKLKKKTSHQLYEQLCNKS